VRRRLTSLILLAGCGGSSADDGFPTAPTQPINVNGPWVIQAAIANPDLRASCSMSGTLFLAQTGNQFTGTLTQSHGTCSDPSGQVSGALDGLVEAGGVNGDQVSYAHGPCALVGETNSRSDEVEGTITCIAPYNGETVPASGTWRMTR
jgi:hypothetical protein